MRQAEPVTGALDAGIYEALLTERLATALADLPDDLIAELGDLVDAEAADRVAWHFSGLLKRAIETAREKERAAEGVRLARELVGVLHSLAHGRLDLLPDLPVVPPQQLAEISTVRPDGSRRKARRPLTPLMDSTVFTNAPGEPAIAHELITEIDSADEIDVLMAFIRWSGVRSLLPELKRHCDSGRRLRVLTTTYTNSTEQIALDRLAQAGAEICVSYDTSATRLHAKGWIFHRQTGYSTAYLGSSNLTFSAQVTGLEWNVRLAEARNADAVAKMRAVFESYWQSLDFKPYDPQEFARNTRQVASTNAAALSPVEVVLKPFQEDLLDRLSVSRHQGRHRNLLVSATGTGKTVMAAVDYARLRSSMRRSRLLFIAHRVEILDQSLATFRHALRDLTFGEKWVAGERPQAFDHVFASVQSLSANGLRMVDPQHFDFVIIDEFHHAAAPTYRAVLEQLHPRELLGLTATPERADGLDVLAYFDGRIAAELRLWEAIDQQYLAPFDYFGISDGSDLRSVPWKRGHGYDVAALTKVFTADHVWAHRVIHELEAKVADPQKMRCIAFCVSVQHAHFMAERFAAAGLKAQAVDASTPSGARQAALRDLSLGSLNVLCAVDLFNEGVDLPNVDTLLLLRPTDSGTLFLQQLGRGLRKVHGKGACTVLDFVGLQRKEFRFDRKLRALLGGSRRDLERQIEQEFPFLPAGCNFSLDRVATQLVLDNIREAIPSRWKEQVSELRRLGNVTLSTYLKETGLDLADIYSNNRSWSELRRAVDLATRPAGPNEAALLRAVGRLAHVDDTERIAAYSRLAASPLASDLAESDARMAAFLRMLVASLTSRRTRDPLQAGIDEVWQHPQVLAELLELMHVRQSDVSHVPQATSLPFNVPLQVHARYTRIEILAAFGVGTGAVPPTWQTGVWWDEASSTDLFAFTLDKSTGGFSPTTRYRDYAVSPTRIHWQSQAATSVTSEAGQRYINHLETGTRIVLFARLRTTDRAFWCLGPARYVRHDGDRPVSFEWELEVPLPADLYTAFAAAVA